MKLRTLVLPMALLAAACSSGTDEQRLPGPDTLLRRSAAAMASVTTTRFSLQAEGRISGLDIRSAEGVLTSEGEASGTVDLEQSGSLVEFEFVITKDAFYVKGPTGGWRKIPRFLAIGFYDPTKLLDPDSGVSRLLRTADPVRTEAADEVNGTLAYRVAATLQGDELRSLLPVDVKEDRIPASLWIGADEPHLLQARVTFASTGEAPRSTLSVTLSDLNAPATIEPPEE